MPQLLPVETSMKSPPNQMFLIAILAGLILSPAIAAADNDWEALLGDEGWEVHSVVSHDEIGPVEIALKTIGGLTCLRGVSDVDVSAQTLVGIAADIPAALRWSKAGLLESEVLGRGANHVDYMQFLDVPNWTMANDRFWVLRGRQMEEGLTGTLSFRWETFDSRSRYPMLYHRLANTYPQAVEPPVNYGSWSFLPEGGGAKVRYSVCSDTGGRLPASVQRLAATRTLPDTIADLVREGRRRAMEGTGGG